MRSVLTILVTLILATAAFADVVILRGNDVPLMGRILSETDDVLIFQVRGLGDGSRFEIEKSRVKVFWREKSTYGDYPGTDETRQERIENVQEQLNAATPEPVAPPRAPIPRSRTSGEIRQHLFDRAVSRIVGVVPTSSVMRVLLVVLSLVAFSGLFWVGGRVASLRRLGLAKAAILSLLMHLFIATAWLAPNGFLEPEAVPILVALEVCLWILAVRLLAGSFLSRAVLLLSFSLATVLLVGGSLFSVLSVF